MNHQKKVMTRITHVILWACFSFFMTSTEAVAAPVVPPSSLLPNTVQPGVISNTMQQQQKQMTRRRPVQSTIEQEEEPASNKLGAAAEHIKFKLIKIELEGNHAYSDETLSKLYQDKLNKIIVVSDLIKIVQDITNYYRNNGYVLSRAVLPPQRVQGGVVKVRILEGFIDKIRIEGVPKGAAPLIQGYTKVITQVRPLKISTLEYYLRLVNQVPGVNVKAVLEPSKTTLAASTLNLVAQTKTASWLASYDNYGTRYIGPNQVSGGVGLNSIFRPGDSTRFFYTTTSRPNQLKYGDISYGVPVGDKGWRLLLDANQSNTEPGLNLEPLDVKGLSNDYTALLEYPVILSRATDLVVRGGFDYLDSGVTTFGSTLYQDHLRMLTASADFNHADQYKGTNNVNASIVQGLNILGATNSTTSLTTSRFGGEGTFTKLGLQASRLQQLWSRFSGFLLAKGQYSFQPLLASEQYAFGGSQLGRGYDPADIIGDLGLGGTVELRADYVPEWRFLQYVQPFVFYDIGVIWNRKNVIGTKIKQSESSTGGGLRFIFTPHLSGSLMIGQPLTKQDTTEEIVGNGRKPRGLFSITASG